jgi:hypothetical protein
MSNEERKCVRCGGAMENGFLCSDNSIGDHAITRVERSGWMAGDGFQFEKVGVWILKTSVVSNLRRSLTASRCTSCGVLELFAR